MRKAGQEIDPADLPPGMEWEQPVWELYDDRLRTQWRQSFGGRTGLDYNPAIKLIEHYGWDVDFALDLLGAIEQAVLEKDEKQRERERANKN